MTVSEHAVHYLEIVTPDVEGARRLYGTAYGWSFREAEAGLGDAVVATLPDGSLCGIRAPMHVEEKPIVRAYLRVGDLDGAVRSAASSGAEILLERMVIPGHGTIAIYRFGGIQQGLWQLP